MSCRKFDTHLSTTLKFRGRFFLQIEYNSLLKMNCRFFDQRFNIQEMIAVQRICCNDCGAWVWNKSINCQLLEGEYFSSWIWKKNGKEIMQIPNFFCVYMSNLRVTASWKNYTMEFLLLRSYTWVSRRSKKFKLKIIT